MGLEAQTSTTDNHEYFIGKLDYIRSLIFTVKKEECDDNKILLPVNTTTI